MPWKFNPFSVTLDQTGSGGGGGAQYIDGEVATYNDLPLDGTAALNSAWLVRQASGTWLIGRKPAGIYIRTATGGSSRDADYTYAGIFPDVFSDANFTLYDNGDSTRTAQFQLSGITAGQNRVLTVPNSSGTIALTSDFAAPPSIGSTTPNTVAATTMSATGAITGAVAGTTSATSGCNGFQIPVPAAGGSSAVGMYGAFSSGSARAVIFGASTSGTTSTIADFSANGLVASSIQNTPIGSTTASTGAFTTLNATGTTELVNGTNAAGPFRVYNTSDNSNADYERGFIGWISNVFTIGVEKAGTTVARSFAITLDGTTRLSISNNTNTGAAFASNVSLSAGFGIGFRSGNFSTAGTTLHSDASDTLDFRRTTNPQTFRLYTTYVSGTSFERLSLRGQTTNNFIIATEKGTTGGAARGLELQTDSVTRLTLGNAGGVTIADANDIAVGTTTGTKIGTATTQKIGFFNKTPVVQPTAVADATDAATVITQLNALLSRMRDLGLIAT